MAGVESMMNQTRRPSAEELPRLEKAFRTLRATARGVAFVAYVLPFALGGVTTVLTFTTHVGGWPEKLGLSLLQIILVSCVFQLPIRLSSTGHTLRSYRGMKRDAEQGFTVVQREGEVSWGRRQGAHVARVGTLRLISASFTGYDAMAAYWTRFDTLAPGRYLFELLPESGFVLSARALSPERASGFDDTPVAIALRAAFRVSAADLAANREGRATAAQRWRLLVSYLWAALLTPVLGTIAVKTLRILWETPRWGTAFGALCILSLSAFAARLLLRAVGDAWQARLACAVGVVDIGFSKTDATCSIGGIELSLSHRRAGALRNGQGYRLYWFRHSRIVASAEPES